MVLEKFLLKLYFYLGIILIFSFSVATTHCFWAETIS